MSKASDIAKNESKFYGDNISDAWENSYGNMEGSGSGSFFSGFPLKDLVKIGVPYLLAKQYGEGKVDKYGNEALARANSSYLELLQEKETSLNSLTEMSIVSNREADIRKNGYGDVQSAENIMAQIVKEISPASVTEYKNLIEAMSADSANKGTTYTNPKAALKGLAVDIQREAIKKFDAHNKINLKYKAERTEDGFLPEAPSYDKEGVIIPGTGRTQGYLNKIDSSLIFVQQNIQNIKADMEKMNWVDGILMKFGIKDKDRTIIKAKALKENAAEEAKKIMRAFSFEFPFSSLDESLELEVAERVKAGLFTVTNKNGKEIPTPYSELTESDLIRLIQGDTYKSDNHYKAYVSQVAINAIRKTSSLDSISKSTKTIEDAKFKFNDAQEILEEVGRLNNDLTLASEKYMIDRSDIDNQGDFIAAWNAVFELEQSNIENGFGVDYFAANATALGLKPEEFLNNEINSFITTYTPLLSSGLLYPYQIVHLKNKKDMLMKKGKAAGLSVDALNILNLDPNRKPITYDHMSKGNRKNQLKSIEAKLISITALTTNTVEQLKKMKPDLNPNSQEFKSIVNYIENNKAELIGFKNLLTNKLEEEPTPDMATLEISHSSLVGEYVREGWTVSDATLKATLDLLAGIQYNASVSGATQREKYVFGGGRTGDIDTWDSIVLIDESTAALKGGYLRPRGDLNELPIFTRLLTKETLRNISDEALAKQLKLTSVGIGTQYDHLDTAAKNLKINKIYKDLKTKSENFTSWYSSTGKYIKGNKDDYLGKSEMEASDQAQVMSMMVIDLMKADASFEKRIMPFYKQIQQELTGGMFTPGGFGLYSGGASDEVSKYEEILLQEFAIIKRLASERE